MSKLAPNTVRAEKDDFTWLPCAKCNVETQHEILAAFVTNVKETQPGDQEWEEHQIVRCGGCRQIIFSTSGSTADEYSWMRTRGKGRHAFGELRFSKTGCLAGPK